MIFEIQTLIISRRNKYIYIEKKRRGNWDDWKWKIKKINYFLQYRQIILLLSKDQIAELRAYMFRFSQTKYFLQIEQFFTLRWQCVSIFAMPICILFGTLLSTVVLCVARCDAAFAAANFIGNEETFVVDSIVETQRALEGSRWRDVVAKIVLPRA